MDCGSVQNNVISIFAKKVNTDDGIIIEVEKEELSFAEVMRRNKSNDDRLRKERQKANKNVIRSYRLKPKA
ncbi:MAG: hypothetical protein AB7T49_06575 [Oligoflexales bacterium]